MVKVNSSQKISVMSNRVKAVWNDFKLDSKCGFLTITLLILVRLI